LTTVSTIAVDIGYK